MTPTDNPSTLSVNSLQGLTADLPSSARPRGRIAAAIAGVLYVLSWVVGLSVFPSDLLLDASGSAVADAYARDSAAGVLQYTLVEGLAAIFLGVVLIGAAVAATAPGVRRALAVTGTAAAVAISLAQCTLGVIMIAAARSENAEVAGGLYAWVNRLDGAKMTLIALVAVALITVTAITRRLPVLLRIAGLALAVALVASAVAYGFLLSDLAWTAYVSGVLLLAWVASTGIWLGARRHKR